MASCWTSTYESASNVSLFHTCFTFPPCTCRFFVGVGLCLLFVLVFRVVFAFFLRLAERAVKHCRSSRTRGGMNKTPPKHLQNTEKHNTNKTQATTTTNGKCKGER